MIPEDAVGINSCSINCTSGAAAVREHSSPLAGAPPVQRGITAVSERCPGQPRLPLGDTRWKGNAARTAATAATLRHRRGAADTGRVTVSQRMTAGSSLRTGSPGHCGRGRRAAATAREVAVLPWEVAVAPKVLLGGK